MKKKPRTTGDDEELVPHYDFKQMPIIARGPGYQRRAKLVKMTRVTLDPDIEPFFPDDQAVNEALRTLIRLVSEQKIQVARSSKRKSQQS
jgi:hypothetical protein